jgi:hypothetical protein
MDLRRLGAGEWIAGASGCGLLASLFLPWYDVAGTGWKSFAVVDVVLAMVAAAAVALLVVTATQAVAAVPVAMDALVTLAGIAATVVVIVEAVAPSAGAGSRQWGLWLGLAGALGVAVGALLAMRDERPSPSGRHTDQTGRPTPPPAPVETLPAPGGERAT